jgi:hypothetical protein
VDFDMPNRVKPLKVVKTIDNFWLAIVKLPGL